MIFPIGDDQIQGGHKPYVSYAFIVLNILFFLIQFITPGKLICELGAIPNEIVGGQDIYTLLSSIFMHADLMHLIGNMLFLWVFADNIEATIGSVNFLSFYILGGVVASAAHIFFSIQSPDVAGCYSPCISSGSYTEGMPICAGSTPSVGASGAISAVMGAYLVMFPKSQIKIFVAFLFRSFHISALFFLGFWIIQQVFSGFLSFAPSAQGSGVAWWAHIGGFVFGLAAGLLFKKQANNHYDESV